MKARGDFMKHDRLQDMASYIHQVQSVTIEELLEKYTISIQTLRRDLNELEKQNIVRKVYGGVVTKEERVERTFVLDVGLRQSVNFEQKKHIGQLAAALIEDNDIIFVDSGTTAYQLIPFLKNGHNITVISHSLHVMNALAQLTSITAICLGGVLRKETYSFLSDTSTNQYYFNKAFISTVGLSITKGLTNTDFHEGIMKQHIIQNADKVFILCDSSKFGEIAFNHFADFSEVDAIITDTQPSDIYIKFFEKNKIEVID